MFTQLRTAIGSEALLQLLTPAINGELANLSPLHDAILTSFLESPAMLSLLFHSTALLKEKPELAVALIERAYHHATSESIRTQIKGLAKTFKLKVLLHRKKIVSPPGLTTSQIRVAARLRCMAERYFAGPQKNGITLRFNPFLLGPSGVGKTFLAQALAQSLDVPFLRLTVGDWLVSGSKCEPTTLQTLQAQLTESDRLVLFIDEVDKLSSPRDSTWSMSVLTELFSVLDRQVNFRGMRGQPWTSLHTERLKNGVFIIGAGTWQDLWMQSERTACGFAGDKPAPFDEAGFIRKVRQAQAIPPEILLRFNDDFCVLHPYTADDFAQIAARLKLEPGVIDPVAAAASGMNFRAVERACTNHELRLAEASAQLNAVSAP